MCHLIPVQHPCFGIFHSVSSHPNRIQCNAHNSGSNISNNNTKQNGSCRCDALCTMLQHQNNHQHQYTQQQIFQRAIIFGTASSAEGTYAHTDQRQTNRQNNSSCHNRRKKLTKWFNQKTQYGFKQTAQNTGSHNCSIRYNTISHNSRNRITYTDKSRTGSHDNRHFSATGTNRKKLNQRYNSCNQHRILQQCNLQSRTSCNSAGTTDNQDWRQVPDKHCQHMLKAHRNGLLQRNTPFKLIRAGIFLFLSHIILPLFCTYLSSQLPYSQEGSDAI